MPSIALNEELARQAQFVFTGTVRELKAANVDEIRKTERNRTVIVKVIEVLQAPEIFSDYAGREVTVKLAEGEKVKAGERVTFYTTAWIFGENLAVESIGHEAAAPAARSRAAARNAPTDSPAEALANQRVMERLETADAVVMGTVTKIRKPRLTRTGARSLAADADSVPTRRPITEHDPNWREAVIEVAGAEKGEMRRKNVVVRFPDSDDVRWHKAPKFRAGQKGVFILHRTLSASPRGPRPAAVLTNDEADTVEEVFTALHPADVQPLKQRKEIRALIQSLGQGEAQNGEDDDQ
jgi:hypothetical protein